MADEKALATIEKDISDKVLTRIGDMVDKNELALADGYNAGTMLRAAMLMIKETKDKNGKTALEVCSGASVANCFLNMCIQGLDPTKRQCYFIVYGNQLQLFRSYFGTQAALRRAVPSVGKIVTDLVHQGDDVEFGTTAYGERYAVRIVTDPITNIEKPIVYGFCNIFGKDGELMGSTLMTWKDIQKSWSKTRSGGQTQKDFPEEMARRTLINRACKHILNSSVDSNSAVVAAFNHTTDNEYMDEQKVQQSASKPSLKERYNIKGADEAVEAKAQKVEEPSPEPPAEEDIPWPDGPEMFEDSPFDGCSSDSLPNSEYNEGLF